MITVETQPRGRGHRDDGQEEEIQQADNDTKRKKVTNKHHQRGESSQQGHTMLVGSRSSRRVYCLVQDATERPDSCRRNGKRGECRSEGRVLSNSELPASLSGPRSVISLDVLRSRRSWVRDTVSGAEPNGDELQDMTNEMEAEACSQLRMRRQCPAARG